MGGISMDSAVFDSAVTTTAPAALKIQREGNAGYHLATAEQLTDGVKFLVTRQGAAVGNALTWNVYQKTSGGYSETAKASGTVAANADSFTVAFDGATVGKSYRVVLSYGTETAVFNILVIDSVG